MTYLKKYFSIFSLFIFLFLACSSDSNSNEDAANAKGIITLTGEETSVLGNSLSVANAVEGLYQTGTGKSVTLLHKSIDVDSDGGITPTSASFTNSFIIVTAQFESGDNASVHKAISMTIVKNGEEYLFTCTAIEGETVDDDCGANFLVDQEDKRVVFDNTTVINTDSGKVLTMDGIVTW